MADETATLAAYVVNLQFDDIPQEVLERAKVLTLDYLGSTIRARRDSESTPALLKMLEALSLDGAGEATVFGDSRTWTPAIARFRRYPCRFLAASQRPGGARGLRRRRDGRGLRQAGADRDRGRL
jgi:hypothetical protein